MSIAFHSYDSTTASGARAPDAKLWIHDLRSRSTTLLKSVSEYVQHATNPRFSKNGRFLAFTGLPRNRRDYGKHWRRWTQVYVFDFRAQLLIDVSFRTCVSSSDTDPDFSPVSDVLVFARNNSAIWWYNIENGEHGKITTGVQGEKSALAYSPDGNWIAFVLVNSSEQSAIYRIHAHDSRCEAISDIDCDSQIRSLRFLDSDLLVYTRSGDCGDQIYELRISGGVSTLLIAHANDPFRILSSGENREEEETWVGISAKSQGERYQVCRCNKKTIEEICSIPNEDCFGGAYSQEEIPFLHNREHSGERLTVTFIRHAEAEHNALVAEEKYSQGLALRDPPLTAVGIRQAETLQRRLEGEIYDLVICSPMRRAIQTAEIVFRDRSMPPLCLPLISERGGSTCDTGREVRILKQEFPAFDFCHASNEWFRSFQRETERACESRVDNFRRYLEKLNFRSIAVVSHGGFMYRLTKEEFENTGVLKVQWPREEADFSKKRKLDRRYK